MPTLLPTVMTIIKEPWALILFMIRIYLLSVDGGYVWHYKQYLDGKQYAAAQGNALKGKLGLWSLSNPIPPWNWRKTEKTYR